MQKLKPKVTTPRWTRVLILSLVVSLAGCGPPPVPVTDPAGLYVTVQRGKKIWISASAARASSYEWELQGDGEISKHMGSAILYTMSEKDDTIAILTVTAFNAQGASPQTSLIIVPPPYVRLDALAVPTSWASNKSGDLISYEVSPGSCYTGLDCLRFTYRTGGGEGGVYWAPMCIVSLITQSQDKARRIICPLNVLEASNLVEVRSLTFWARGNRGGEMVEFRVGGADLPPIPGRSLGTATLTPDWELYEIKLQGLDLTNATGLFLWIATDSNNPQGAIFYLDDIQFEGVR